MQTFLNFFEIALLCGTIRLLELFETTQQVKIRLCPFATFFQKVSTDSVLFYCALVRTTAFYCILLYLTVSKDTQKAPLALARRAFLRLLLRLYQLTISGQKEIPRFCFNFCRSSRYVQNFLVLLYQIFFNCIPALARMYQGAFASHL